MTTVPPSAQKKRQPLTLPCTKSKSAPVCQLVRRLAAYNEVLWYIGLEIREENGLGELVIATVPGTGIMYPSAYQSIHCESLAMILVSNLLSHHHCIVAVELTYEVARSPFLLKLLQGKYSVKKLTISYVPYFDTNVPNALVKLVSPSGRRGTLHREEYPCFSVNRPLLAFPHQQDSINLTSLDVADMGMSGDCAQQFIDMLLQNDTITDLTVGACVFSYRGVDILNDFVTYLQNEQSVLKKLTVRMPEVRRRRLESLVKAIASATTLEEMVFDIDIFDVEDKALLAEIVARNRTLHTLSTSMWTRNCVVSTILYDIEPLGGDTAARIEPWLLALPQNTTLSALTMDLLGFSDEQCCAFFRAVALNKTLKNVYIGHLPACSCLEEICQIIRDSRIARAIYIADHHVSIYSLPMLPECAEVTSVTISSVHLPNMELLVSAFKILASCSHVTSLRVCVLYFFLDEIQAPMAAYISEARTLKDIEVHVYVDVHHERREQHHDLGAQCLLVNALASNPSLKKITLGELSFTVNNAEFLAAAFVNSQNLTELSFAAFSRSSNNAFLQTLMSGIEKNYTLLRVELPSCKDRNAELVVIRNVTRRNASLVNRAARFVMCDHDPYNASAVELVSGHERVLSIVQENAGVQSREAALMIKRALGHRCLTGLDEYMKLAGVVKRRVECLRRHSIELDQLSYDCWAHIRKFLMVADVVVTD